MFKFPDAVHQHDWFGLLAIAIATTVIGYVNGFAAPGIDQFAPAIPAVVLLTCAAVWHHMGHTPKRVGILTFISWVMFSGMVLAYSCYVFASTGLPVQDAQLLALDHAIGIDPLAFRFYVSESEWLSKLLTLAYTKTGIQLMIGILVVMLLRDNFRRMRMMVSVYLLGICATLIGMALVPAIGAFPHLDMSRFDQGFLNNDKTASYISHYLGLRDGTLREFPTTNWEGIVTFPSFHTIASLTAAYAVWPIRWLFWPSAAFSVLVMISTLPVGGHYAVDVIGAVLVFAASVLWVERRERIMAGIDAPAVSAGRLEEVAA